MITEVKRNLFDFSDTHYLAHCIASDLKMGAGIAVDFQRKFGLRGAIMNASKDLTSPTCVLANRVFNLITKKTSHGKPTYASVRVALRKMRQIIENKNIKEVAMPRIGCGLDRLVWPKVKEIIQEVFEGCDVNITVCRL